jgi:hypothetical protein
MFVRIEANIIRALHCVRVRFSSSNDHPSHEVRKLAGSSMYSALWWWWRYQGLAHAQHDFILAEKHSKPEHPKSLACPAHVAPHALQHIAELDPIEA